MCRERARESEKARARRMQSYLRGTYGRMVAHLRATTPRLDMLSLVSAVARFSLGDK